MQALTVTDSPPSPVKTQKEKVVPTPKTSPFVSSMDVAISAEAELYLWDPAQEQFENQGIVTAAIMQQTNSTFVYWLTASSSDGHLLAHRFSADMNQRFSHKMRSLTWNHLADDGSQRSWLFRFGEAEFGEFLNKFTQCLWETLHHAAWAKAKVYFTF